MLAFSAPAARAAPAKVDLPAAPLAQALTQLARQAGWQILFDPQLLRGRSLARPLDHQEPRAALRKLLRGSGLEARWIGPQALMIVRAAGPDPGDTSPDPREASPQSIIVTALKRDTAMADTPISMEVERGVVLAATGAKDVRAVARRHPALTVLDSGSGQQRLIMRGISGAGEATVGVYYDESPVSGPGGTTFDPGATSPDLDLVDIDRLELLRGPQGTLYGASAMGGVVRVIFNRPDPTGWHGEARSGIEQTQGADLGWNGSLVLNAPLVTDHLAARLAVYRRHAGGYLHNESLGIDHMGQLDKTGGRLALAWTPDAQTLVQASAILQRTTLDNVAFWVQGDGRFANNQPTRTPQRNDLQLYNLTARRDLGGLSALLTVSRSSWHIVRQTDYTSVLAKQKGDASACRSYFSLASDASCSSAQVQEFSDYVDSRLPGILYQPMQLGSWNAELRLSSDKGAHSNWTLGTYFERRHEDVSSYVLLADATTGAALTPFDITGLRSLYSDLSQEALFGEWTQQLGSALSATLGARVFHYRRESGGTVTIPNRITGTSAFQNGHYADGETGTNLKALLSYQPNRTLLAYALVSQGFRPGGVNVTPSLTSDLRGYQSDRLWNYEAGLKASALGQRLTVNLDGFHIVWSNMITPLMTSNGSFAYNVNIGSARIDGIELETGFEADRHWSLGACTSLLHARLAANQPIDTLGLVAHKGDRLPNVPGLSFSLSLQRRDRIAANLLATTRIDFAYVGAITSAFDPSEQYFERTPPRSQADAQFAIEGRRWDAGLSIRNLLNQTSPERIVSSAFRQGQVYSQVPRTISLDLAWHY